MKMRNDTNVLRSPLTRRDVFTLSLTVESLPTEKTVLHANNIYANSHVICNISLRAVVHMFCT